MDLTAIVLMAKGYSIAASNTAPVPSIARKRSAGPPGGQEHASICEASESSKLLNKIPGPLMLKLDGPVVIPVVSHIMIIQEPLGCGLLLLPASTVAWFTTIHHQRSLSPSPKLYKRKHVLLLEYCRQHQVVDQGLYWVCGVWRGVLGGVGGSSSFDIPEIGSINATEASLIHCLACNRRLSNINLWSKVLLNSS